MPSRIYGLLKTINLFTICILVILCMPHLQAQSHELSKYTIHVELDTTQHTIVAEQMIDYFNNSGVDLNKIYIHLWANAYKSNNTKLVEQALMLGQSDLYFLPEKHRGAYSILELLVESKQVSSYYEDDDQEILVIELNDKLAANARLNIEIEYEIKIPKLTSRFGRVEDYYQMTHWYPRVAKCESGLWHAMPYLAIGEYYHDFADYEVYIKIPKSHQLIATGTNENDIKGSYKYTAENVTDFAWFVSDEFSFETEQAHIGEDIVQLKVAKLGDKKAWSNAMDYLKRSVDFLSNEIGSYPYPDAKLIMSPYGMRSGMEYPMITVISETEHSEIVDHLIVHEIAHNWFYAAISTNERRYPWMDEGLSTFYDHKYHKQYYNTYPYQNVLGSFLDTDSPLSFLESSIVAYHNLGKLKGSSLHSDAYSGLSYGISIYERMAMGFEFLEAYLGKDKFKSAVSEYYSKFKFSHPTPADLRTVFESVSDRDLSWFFDGFIVNAASADYCIKSINNDELEIENKGQVAIPFASKEITGSADTIITWNEGFLGSKTFDINSDSIQEFSLPVSLNKLDVDPWNNQKRGLGFKFLTGIDNPERKMIFGTPYVAFNEHDGMYAGFAAYNSSYPSKRLRWFIAPALSITGTETNLVGLASLQYDIFKNNGQARKFIAGINLKRFSYFSSDAYSLDYNKLKGFLRLYFNTEPKSRVTKYIELNANLIREESAIFNEEDIFFEDKYRIGQQLIYNYRLQDPIADVFWQTKLEYQAFNKLDSEDGSYLNLSSRYRYKYQFARSKFLEFSFFGSYFLHNTERQSSSFFSQLNRASISLIDQGFTDQFYDQFYLGRNLQSGILSRQVGTEGGGFKNAVGSSYRTGLSNHYAFSVNFMIDTPLFLKPYFDLGYYASKNASESSFQNKSLWSIGLALELFDDSVGFYLPLFNSSELGSIYETQSFFSKLSFRIDLNKLDLWKASEDLNF